MDIERLDIGTLRVFDAVYRKGSVSSAARLLGLPQSSASRILAGLRETLQDDLFVRAQGSMKPTPAADHHFQIVSEILAVSERLRERVAPFDPSTVSRTFKIAASDVGQLISLLAARNEPSESGGIQLQGLNVDGSELASWLSDGRADLAVGGYPKLLGGIKAQRLYSERYACFCSPEHEYAQSPVEKVFLQSRHCIVSAKGMAHVHRTVERALLNSVPERNIRSITTSFFAGIVATSQSDLIVTAPQRILGDIAKKLGLVSLPPPGEVADFDVKQYWHDRFTEDPCHRWLRNRLYMNTAFLRKDE